MHAVIPIRGFSSAKTRLGPTVPPTERAELARLTATRVVGACDDAGFEVVVVSSDPDVAAWGDHRCLVIQDPDDGLDAATRAGVDVAEGPWVVVHADLPLLDAATMRTVAALLQEGRSVAAPSRDGGTNLMGSTVPVSFAYGPGSFHRHLARLPRPAAVLVDPKTLIELDTPGDLSEAARTAGGDWLERFLG
jgi:2-phospho-L-lactate guanylyltransferase